MFSRGNDEQSRHSSLCVYISRYQSKCEMVQKTLIKNGSVAAVRIYCQWSSVHRKTLLRHRGFFSSKMTDSLAALGGTVHRAAIGVLHGQEPCPACASIRWNS